MTLVEEGFSVVSTDASDKMLKYALKERWARRKDDRFDAWGKEKHELVESRSVQLLFSTFFLFDSHNW